MAAQDRTGDSAGARSVGRAPAGRAPAGRAPAGRAPAGREPASRTTDQRDADHADLARLADTLVPALVGRLGGSSLGEIEIREDGWTVRVRRSSAAAQRSGERVRHPGHTGPQAPAAPAASAAASAGPARSATVGADHTLTGAVEHPAVAAPTSRRSPALAPVVGVFRRGVEVGARVRAGDRIAVVDLLGIAQDVIAPIDGRLVEVYPQNGDGVEYGEEVAMVEAEASAQAASVAASAQTASAPAGEG